MFNKSFLIFITFFFIIILQFTAYPQKLVDFLDALDRTKGIKERIKIIKQVPKIKELSDKDRLFVRERLLKIFQKDPEPKVRKTAAISLGELSLARSQLQKSFHDEDIIVKQGIMQALATIGSRKSIAYFLFGYQQKDLIIKNWALVGIAKAGDPRHLDLLLDAINKNLKNINTTTAVLISIGKFGHKYKHWRIIKPYFRRSHKELIIAAIIASAHLQNVKAIPIIADNLSHKNIEIAKVAITSLGKFHGYQPIKALILYKNKNKNSKTKKLVTYTLKHLKAARYYAILKHPMYLRKKYFKSSRILATLKSGVVVEVKHKTIRKFTVTDPSTNKTHIDHWYLIRTESGKQGYLFGKYLKIIPSFK